jgi:hypothetical protein
MVLRMAEWFSGRHGYRGAEQEITIREDALESLRVTAYYVHSRPQA